MNENDSLLDDYGITNKDKWTQVPKKDKRQSKKVLTSHIASVKLSGKVYPVVTGKKLQASTNKAIKEGKTHRNLSKVKVSTTSFKQKRIEGNLHKRQGDDGIEIYSKSELLSSGKMRKNLEFADDKRDYSLIKDETKVICLYCGNERSKPKTKKVDRSFRFVRQLIKQISIKHNLTANQLESLELPANQSLYKDSIVVDLGVQNEVILSSQLENHFAEITFCCFQYELEYINQSVINRKGKVKHFLKRSSVERKRHFKKRKVITLREREIKRLSSELQGLVKSLVSCNSNKFRKFVNYRIQKTIETINNL